MLEGMIKLNILLMLGMMGMNVLMQSMILILFRYCSYRLGCRLGLGSRFCIVMGLGLEIR